MTPDVALPPPVGITGHAFTALLVVVIPLLAWRLKRKFDAGRGPENPSEFLPSLAFQLVGLLFLVNFTIWMERVRVPAEWPATRGWFLGGILMLIPVVALLRRRSVQSVKSRRIRVRSLGPRSRTDLPIWLLISALAGIAEELAWRGVLPELLARYGVKGDGPYVLSCLSFAFAHLRYGAQGVLMTLLLGALFQMVVIAGQSLFPAMFLHAAINVAVGVAAIRSFTREAAVEVADAR